MHRYYFPLLLILLLSGCAAPSEGCLASVCVAPPPPDAAPYAAVPPQAASLFSARISIPFSEIVARVSQAIPARVIEITGKDLGRGFKADIVVDRDPFAMSGSGTSVSVRTAFSTHVHVYGRCPWKCALDVNADGTIWATSAIALNPDWTVRSSTSADFDLSAAHIDIGPIHIPVKGLLTNILRPKLAAALPQIDQKLATLQFKPLAEKPWQALSAAIPLSSAPAIWLALHPSAVQAGPLANDTGAASLVTGIIATPQVTVSDAPPPVAATPLPDLQIAPALGDDFHIRLRAGISSQEATAIARAKLMGSEFDLGHGARMAVTDVAITTSGKLLVAHVSFTVKLGMEAMLYGYRTVAGSIYLVGAPVYDNSTKTLRVEDFDYDVKTKKMLLLAADWLLHNDAREAVQKKLTFPIGDALEKQRQALETSLAGIDLSPTVHLSGTIDQLGVTAIYVTESGVELDATADGRDEITVH